MGVRSNGVKHASSDCPGVFGKYPMETFMEIFAQMKEAGNLETFMEVIGTISDDAPMPVALAPKNAEHEVDSHDEEDDDHKARDRDEECGTCIEAYNEDVEHCVSRAQRVQYFTVLDHDLALAMEAWTLGSICT